MASVEPLTNHLVMSPLWITRSLQEDNGKRTAPFPRPSLPASMEALSLLLKMGFGYSWVTPAFRNLVPLARVHVIMSKVYFSFRRTQRKRVEK